MPQFCDECNRTYKSIINTELSICKHIEGKTHNKNKKKNNEKCYNTLLTLVRNNVDSNLIDNINERVIKNYDTKRRTNNSIYSYEKKQHTQQLRDDYGIDYGIKQLTANDNIGFRLLISDDSSKLLEKDKLLLDATLHNTHYQVKYTDDDYLNTQKNNICKLLGKINIELTNIKSNTIHLIVEKYNYDDDLEQVIKTWNIEHMIELEDMINDAPILKLNQKLLENDNIVVDYDYYINERKNELLELILINSILILPNNLQILFFCVFK